MLATDLSGETHLFASVGGRGKASQHAKKSPRKGKSGRQMALPFKNSVWCAWRDSGDSFQGAKPCGRKQKGGVELRGARRHLGKAQSKQSVVTTRWYLHYRLSRPTPWRHQQDGLTAEVPKPGGRCRSALWERALLPQSLLSQTVVRRCEPIQPSCTVDPGLCECLPSVAAAADKNAASPHCVSSSPGSQPCCFRKLCG
ncbi:hypothetical protein MHYP_G00114410 [Metynnis hypsauchen]